MWLETRDSLASLVANKGGGKPSAPPDAKTSAKVGHAGETISKTADSGKFDLVVMGSHGHGTLGKLVMGSVATQVLAHCKVPVLLVR